MRNVYSSHVDSVGYDAAEAELHVEFKDGTRIVYKAVSAPVAAEILGAPSVGKALHTNIRGKYEWREHD